MAPNSLKGRFRDLFNEVIQLTLERKSRIL